MASPDNAQQPSAASSSEEPLWLHPVTSTHRPARDSGAAAMSPSSAAAATAADLTPDLASPSSSSLRARKPASRAAGGQKRSAEKQEPLAQVDGPGAGRGKSTMPTMEPSVAAAHPKWVALALFSGAFAAMNGVFAKLTTSENTVSLAASLNHLLPFIDSNLLVILLRAAFFGLNLASNAIMWVLFTRALTSHPSTTKVSVVNTSANFTITAIMGSLVFGEAVGGIGGIAGLALLVGGCVVLGAEVKKSETETIDGEPIVDAEAAEALLEAHDIVTDDLISLDGEVKVIDPKMSGGILEGTESEDELVIIEDR